MGFIKKATRKLFGRNKSRGPKQAQANLQRGKAQAGVGNKSTANKVSKIKAANKANKVASKTVAAKPKKASKRVNMAFAKSQPQYKKAMRSIRRRR